MFKGCGTEIYHKADDKMYLIGTTTGGDDGFCPFAEGLYSLKVNGDELHIKWTFNHVNNETIWRENTFKLKKRTKGCKNSVFTALKLMTNLVISLQSAEKECRQDKPRRKLY